MRGESRKCVCACAVETTPDRSRSEIERTLERYGATAYAYGWQDARGVIQFELSGRRYRIVVPLPTWADPDINLTPTTRRRRTAAAAQQAYDQATRQRWRALALYIKATLEATEAGITTPALIQAFAGTEHEPALSAALASAEDHGITAEQAETHLREGVARLREQDEQRRLAALLATPLDELTAEQRELIARRLGAGRPAPKAPAT